MTVWVLEELGLDYNVKVHFRTAAGRAPDALKTVISLGSVCLHRILITHTILTSTPGPSG